MPKVAIITGVTGQGGACLVELPLQKGCESARRGGVELAGFHADDHRE